MFCRVEVVMRPEFDDPAANGLLRRLELAHPAVRKRVRWARIADVYWIDVPADAAELASACREIFWDPVLTSISAGELLREGPGVAGLMKAAGAGAFWGLERKFRPGVTDNVGRTGLEAFEIVLGRKLPGARVASGSLLLLEGPELSGDDLAAIARDVLCNELIESWHALDAAELAGAGRFSGERVTRDLPRVSMKGSEKVETVKLAGLSDGELEALSKKSLWALTVAEMRAARDYFANPKVRDARRKEGLPEDPTDVEMEVIAQTWSEHCKHKIFAATIRYADATGSKGPGSEIPSVVSSLFKTTIAGTTAEIPRPWLLSVFSDNAGIVAFDEEDAFCIKVETHNSPSALDPYGGALTGIVGVNRDILGCGLGAKPIFNTDVFCVAAPDYSAKLPDRLLHPRRILEGVRRGVEHGGNKSGIPTVNGALVFDDRFLGKPLIYCGTGGFMPRVSAGRRCETKEISPGDRICMVGGRIGKDGIHGATFSSLALDEGSPATAVQLGDPITQKRAADFLLEARDLGLYRAVTDNGAGGLSSSIGELAQLSGGARMDVSRARTKYPGLLPYELVVSESQERMSVAVAPEKLEEFLALAERRGVEVSELGEFTDGGAFEILYAGKAIASLDLEFLHKGVPKLELQAEWTGRPALPARAAKAPEPSETLLRLLSRPNIASKEWLIRQYDHEVQGTSVIKPLQLVGGVSGPNNGGVIKPKPSSQAGIAVGCGINPKLSDIDPYLMAESAVDEAVRNVLCVGAEFGRPESVLALVDNFCWPDPVSDKGKAAALVRACYGMRRAALALGAPFVSGKDSMKNDFRGKLDGRDVTISVPPTLLVTAVARVPDVARARSADFKGAGDAIYLVGPGKLGLAGSELASLSGPAGVPADARVGEADWEVARKVYAWLGGTSGSRHDSLRSVHDVSEGGTLVAIAETLLARGLGAEIDLAAARATSAWEAAFGEGFHTFVASCAAGDASALEQDWRQAGVPFARLGSVTASGELRVRWEGGRDWAVPVDAIRRAWKREGYWE